MSPPLVEPLPIGPWDVLIVGTGLKQSILACALARANKKVLQLDSNGYYGSSETCFSHLLDCYEWVAQVNNLSAPHRPLQFSNARVWSSDDHFPVNELHKTGRGYTLTLAPNVMYWQDTLLEVLRRAEMTGSFVWQAVGAWWVYVDPKELGERNVRRGVGEVMGEAIAGVGVKVVKAGVKAKGGWNRGRNKKTKQFERESVSTDTPGESPTPILPTPPTQLPERMSRETTTLRTIPPNVSSELSSLPFLKETPCTFEDIAWDPSLTDTHRTTLASFLRYIQSIHNLSDPSNTSESLDSMLTTTFPLPAHLRAHIHSLTLLSTPPSRTPLHLALRRLLTHLSSLGKIPDARSASALLVSYGGAAEMCQIFSRAAAVAGGVNVLGRGVEGLKGVNDNLLEAELSTGETVLAKHVVGSRWDLPLQAGGEQGQAIPQMEVVAKGVYIVNHPLDILFKPKYPDERISPGGCIMAVFGNTDTKAESKREDKPVYILGRASSPDECPMGQSLLYAGVLVREGKVHGEASEEGSGDAAGRIAEEELTRAYTLLDTAVEKVLGRINDSKIITPFTSTVNSGSKPTTPSKPTAPEVIYKLQYAQYASHTLSQTQTHLFPGLIALNDLQLDLPFHGDSTIKEVVAAYEDILGLPRGAGLGDGLGGESGSGEESGGEKAIEGYGSFLMVGEEIRRLMREMEDDGEE